MHKGPSQIRRYFQYAHSYVISSIMHMYIYQLLNNFNDCINISTAHETHLNVDFGMNYTTVMRSLRAMIHCSNLRDEQSLRYRQYTADKIQMTHIIQMALFISAVCCLQSASRGTKPCSVGLRFFFALLRTHPLCGCGCVLYLIVASWRTSHW